MANNALLDDEEKIDLNGTADDTLGDARVAALDALENGEEESVPQQEAKPQISNAQDAAPEQTAAPEEKSAPTFTRDEMIGLFDRGENYTMDQVNAMTDEQYALYDRTAAEHRRAHPTKEESMKRLNDQLTLSEELAKKADFIVEHTDGDDDFKDLHDEMAEASQFLHNGGLRKANDEQAKILYADINAKYDETQKRRGHWEVAWDNLKNGYWQTGNMVYQGMKMTQPGSLDEEDADLIRGSMQYKHDLDIALPQKLGSVANVDWTSPGDVIDYMFDSVVQNVPRTLVSIGMSLAGGAIMPAHPVLGAMLLGTAGTMWMNTGEAVQDQMDENRNSGDIRNSRGWALLQGLGYSLLDGAFGISAWGAKLWAGALRKIGAKEIAERVGRSAILNEAAHTATMSTAKGVAKEVALHGFLGEGFQEMAQSQGVGRAIRYFQTGSIFKPDESVGDAFLEALDEFAGGAAAGVTFGLLGGAGSHVNAKRTVAAWDRIEDALNDDKNYQQLDNYGKLLVKRHLVNDSLLATEGTIDDEVRQSLRICNYDIDREIRRLSNSKGTDKIVGDSARLYLDVFKSQYALENIGDVIDREQSDGERYVTRDGQAFTSELDVAGMENNVDERIEEGPDGKQLRTFVYTCPHTRISIAQELDENGNATGRYTFNNAEERKNPLYNRGFDKDGNATSELVCNSLSEAIERAKELDVFNQWRETKMETKKEIAKKVFANLFGGRGVNLVFVDKPSAKSKSVGTTAAAYDPENNVVELNLGNIRNLGTLYTSLIHERSHEDIAEFLLKSKDFKKVMGSKVVPDWDAFEKYRTELFAKVEGAEDVSAKNRSPDAKQDENGEYFSPSNDKRMKDWGKSAGKAGEEMVVERASVWNLVNQVRDAERGIVGNIVDRVREAIGMRMALDMNIDPRSIAPADVAEEIDRICDMGFLGEEPRVKFTRQEPTTKVMAPDKGVVKSTEEFASQFGKRVSEPKAKEGDTLDLGGQDGSRRSLTPQMKEGEGMTVPVGTMVMRADGRAYKKFPTDDGGSVWKDVQTGKAVTDEEATKGGYSVMNGEQTDVATPATAEAENVASEATPAETPVAEETKQPASEASVAQPVAEEAAKPAEAQAATETKNEPSKAPSAPEAVSAPSEAKVETQKAEESAKPVAAEPEKAEPAPTAEAKPTKVDKPAEAKAETKAETKPLQNETPSPKTEPEHVRVNPDETGTIPQGKVEEPEAKPEGKPTATPKKTASKKGAKQSEPVAANAKSDTVSIKGGNELRKMPTKDKRSLLKQIMISASAFKPDAEDRWVRLDELPNGTVIKIGSAKFTKVGKIEEGKVESRWTDSKKRTVIQSTLARTGEFQIVGVAEEKPETKPVEAKTVEAQPTTEPKPVEAKSVESKPKNVEKKPETKKPESKSAETKPEQEPVPVNSDDKASLGQSDPVDAAVDEALDTAYASMNVSDGQRKSIKELAHEFGEPVEIIGKDLPGNKGLILVKFNSKNKLLRKDGTNVTLEDLRKIKEKASGGETAEKKESVSVVAKTIIEDLVEIEGDEDLDVGDVLVRNFGGVPSNYTGLSDDKLLALAFQKSDEFAMRKLWDKWQGDFYDWFVEKGATDAEAKRLVKVCFKGLNNYLKAAAVEDYLGDLEQDLRVFEADRKLDKDFRVDELKDLISFYTGMFEPRGQWRGYGTAWRVMPGSTQADTSPHRFRDTLRDVQSGPAYLGNAYTIDDIRYLTRLESEIRQRRAELLKKGEVEVTIPYDPYIMARRELIRNFMPSGNAVAMLSGAPTGIRYGDSEKAPKQKNTNAYKIGRRVSADSLFASIANRVWGAHVVDEETYAKKMREIKSRVDRLAKEMEDVRRLSAERARQAEDDLLESEFTGKSVDAIRREREERENSYRNIPDYIKDMASDDPAKLYRLCVKNNGRSHDEMARNAVRLMAIEYLTSDAGHDVVKSKLKKVGLGTSFDGEVIDGVVDMLQKAWDNNEASRKKDNPIWNNDGKATPEMFQNYVKSLAENSVKHILDNETFEGADGKRHLRVQSRDQREENAGDAAERKELTSQLGNIGSPNVRDLESDDDADSGVVGDALEWSVDEMSDEDFDTDEVSDRMMDARMRYGKFASAAAAARGIINIGLLSKGQKDILEAIVNTWADLVNKALADIDEANKKGKHQNTKNALERARERAMNLDFDDEFVVAMAADRLGMKEKVFTAKAAKLLNDIRFAFSGGKIGRLGKDDSLTEDQKKFLGRMSRGLFGIEDAKYALKGFRAKDLESQVDLEEVGQHEAMAYHGDGLIHWITSEAERGTTDSEIERKMENGEAANVKNVRPTRNVALLLEYAYEDYGWIDPRTKTKEQKRDLLAKLVIKFRDAFHGQILKPSDAKYLMPFVRKWMKDRLVRIEQGEELTNALADAITRIINENPVTRKEKAAKYRELRLKDHDEIERMMNENGRNRLAVERILKAAKEGEKRIESMFAHWNSVNREIAEREAKAKRKLDDAERDVGLTDEQKSRAASAFDGVGRDYGDMGVLLKSDGWSDDQIRKAENYVRYEEVKRKKSNDEIVRSIPARARYEMLIGEIRKSGEDYVSDEDVLKFAKELGLSMMTARGALNNERPKVVQFTPSELQERSEKIQDRGVSEGEISRVSNEVLAEAKGELDRVMAKKSIVADAKRIDEIREELKKLGTDKSQFEAKIRERLGSGKNGKGLSAERITDMLRHWVRVKKAKDAVAKAEESVRKPKAEQSASEKPGESANTMHKTIVTDEEDAAYADAVKRGDRDAALRMIRDRINEEAKKIGAVTRVEDAVTGKPAILFGYHGTNSAGFTEFDGGKVNGPFIWMADTKQDAVEYTGNRNMAVSMFSPGSRPISKMTIAEAKKNFISSVLAKHKKIVLEEGLSDDEKIERIADYYGYYNVNDYFKDAGYKTQNDFWEKFIDEQYEQQKQNSRYGVYNLVVKMDNPIVVDAKGRNWEHVLAPEELSYFSKKDIEHMRKEVSDPNSITAKNGKEFVEFIRSAIDQAENSGYQTNQLVMQAKDKGYDGIIFKNIVDSKSGTTMTDIVSFDKTKVKMADADVYDDAGNLIPLSQRFNEHSPDIRYKTISEEADIGADGMYSKLQQVVRESKQDKFGASSLIPFLRGRGVKDEEIKATGLEAFLDGKKSVSKDEIDEWVRTHAYVLERVESDTFAGSFSPRYGRWSVNNAAHNYREVLFEDPNIDWKNPHWDSRKVVAHTRLQDIMAIDHEDNDQNLKAKRNALAKELLDIAIKIQGATKETENELNASYNDLKSQIDEIDKKIGAVNFNGGKVLFVEEVQSDLHQAGRENGYSSEQQKAFLSRNEANNKLERFERSIYAKYNEDILPVDSIASPEEIAEYHRLMDDAKKKREHASKFINSVPSVPYQHTWHEYVMKQNIMEACRNGYDYVAWTTGKMQADRYNLATYVDSISWGSGTEPRYMLGRDQDYVINNPKYVSAMVSTKNRGKDIHVYVNKDSGDIAVVVQHNDSFLRNLEGRRFEDLVGKEIARRVLSEEKGSITGAELSVGGEGMRNFYDVGGKSEQNIPKFVQKYIKQWDGKLEEITLETGDKVVGFRITPEMRESINRSGVVRYKTITADIEDEDVLFPANESQVAHGLISAKFKGRQHKRISQLVQEAEDLRSKEGWDFRRVIEKGRSGTQLSDTEVVAILLDQNDRINRGLDASLSSEAREENESVLVDEAEALRRGLSETGAALAAAKVGVNLKIRNSYAYLRAHVKAKIEHDIREKFGDDGLAARKDEIEKLLKERDTRIREMAKELEAKQKVVDELNDKLANERSKSTDSDFRKAKEEEYRRGLSEGVAIGARQAMEKEDERRAGAVKRIVEKYGVASEDAKDVDDVTNDLLGSFGLNKMFAGNPSVSLTEDQRRKFGFLMKKFGNDEAKLRSFVAEKGGEKFASYFDQYLADLDRASKPSDGTVKTKRANRKRIVKEQAESVEPPSKSDEIDVGELVEPDVDEDIPEVAEKPKMKEPVKIKVGGERGRAYVNKIKMRAASARYDAKHALDDNMAIADIGEFARNFFKLIVMSKPGISEDEIAKRVADAMSGIVDGLEFGVKDAKRAVLGLDEFKPLTKERAQVLQRQITAARDFLEKNPGKIDEALAMVGIKDKSDVEKIEELERRLGRMLDKRLNSYQSMINEKHDEKLVKEITDLVDALDEIRSNKPIGEILGKYLTLATGMRDYRRKQSLKDRLDARIDSLKRRTENHDFEPAPKRMTPDSDKDIMAIQGAMRELERAREKFNKERAQWRAGKLPVGERFLHGLMTILAEAKAIRGSFDLSSMLRQGGQLSWAHPVLFWKNFWKTLEVMKSEEAANDAYNSIWSRPNAKYYLAAGLKLQDWGDSAMSRDDRFVLLNQYRRFTNAKWIKKGINVSERAFCMYLNLMRADVFDAMIAGSALGDASKFTTEDLKVVGNYINIASQYGTIDQQSKMGKALTAANAVLWSPRNFISRIQFIKNTLTLLVPGFSTYGTTDWKMRKMIAKETMRYFTGVAAAIVFSKLMADLFRGDDEPPEDIETDPRSSDFLKVKFGNTRLDFLSGLAPLFVFSSRFATGTTKTLRGQEMDVNRGDLTFRLMRSKFSPMAATVYDIASRETYEKQDISFRLKDQLKEGEELVGATRYVGTNIFCPLSIYDLYDQVKTSGIGRATVTWMLSALGVGAQSFDPYTYKNLHGDYKYFKRLYNESRNAEEQRELVERHPMLKRMGTIEAFLKPVRSYESAIRKTNKTIEYLKKNGGGKDNIANLERAIAEYEAQLEVAKKRAVNAMAGFKHPEQAE